MFYPFSGLNDEFNLNSENFSQKFNETEDSVLIDVRTKDEYDNGHIPGSINLDIYSFDFKEHINNLDRNKSYFLYCRSGNRSFTAGQFMKNLGFEKIFNLQGGILDWNERLITD